MTNPLKLSVIMPVYNALPYFKEAVASVLAQTFEHFELIIVDNNSTDGTREYALGLKDPRVCVYTEARQGPGAAMNAGLVVSRGEFVALVDGDDMTHPERFEKQLAFLSAHPDIVLVGARFAFLVDKQTVSVPPQPREHQNIRKALMEGRPVICNPSIMFRASVAKAIGGNRLDGPGHDVDFFLRMSEAGTVANLPDVLHYYRLHEGSISIRRMSELQMVHSFAVDSAKARAAGKPCVSIEQFRLQWPQRSMLTRVHEYTDRKSLELYRRSVLRKAQSRLFVSFAAKTGSALFSPNRTYWHLKRRMGLC